MRIMMLGFGTLSRQIIDTVKTFPEYGFDGEISVIHGHIRRNSLSYGPDLVVEIPDPHGDGYRTYKDGFQSLKNFTTTISDYEEWLIDEARQGAFDVVIDCTNYNEDSRRLLFRLLENTKAGTKYFLPSKGLVQNNWREIIELAKKRDQLISFNSIPAGDPSQYSELDLNRDTFHDYADNPDMFIFRNGGPVETSDNIVAELRADLDGGLPWTPADRGQLFWDEAANAWAESEIKMKQMHIDRRRRVVSERIAGMGGRPEKIFPAAISDMLPKAEISSIERFIVNNEANQKRHETYDNKYKRKIIQHEMLDWFYAPHIGMDAGTISAFLNAELEISSTRYVEYDSPESYMEHKFSEGACEYVIEYLVDQKKSWKVSLSEGFLMDAEEFQALTYCKDTGDAKRDRLISTDNEKVSMIVFHFREKTEAGPVKCSCYVEEK